MTTLAPHSTLVRQFKSYFETPPEWAWPFVPSIPFIGRNYQPRQGILIYASAENFSWLRSTALPPRLQVPLAWNRYRAAYSELGRHSDAFFPDVGIQPVSDGGLLVAGLFVAETLGLPRSYSPRNFLETVCVSNWAKFTVAHGKAGNQRANEDYANSRRRLSNSLPFVISELLILQPAVALVPATIWRFDVFRAAMQGASPHTRFIAVPQFNARVVNIHLARFERAGKEFRRGASKANALSVWMEHIAHVNRHNAWRYIGYLGKAISRSTASN